MSAPLFLAALPRLGSRFAFLVLATTLAPGATAQELPTGAVDRADDGVIAIDLDGDGTPEHVRDAAPGAPFRTCGLPRAWVDPEVFDPRSERFRRARVLPAPDAGERLHGSPTERRDAPPLIVVPGFASGDVAGPGPLGGPGDPLALAGNGAGWRARGGDWIRFDVPAGLPATALVVAAADSVGALLAIDGTVHRIAIDPASTAIPVPASARCVAVQLLEDGEHTLTIARLETAASEVTDWFDDWAAPTLRAACAAGDEHAAAATARAVADRRTDIHRYATLLGSGDACIDRAAAAHLAASDPGDRERMTWLTTPAIVPEAAERIRASTTLSRTDWLEGAEASTGDARATLLAAAIGAPGDGPTDAAHFLWPLAADRSADTDALLHGVDSGTLDPVATLPRDVALARRVLVVLAAATPSAVAASWVQRLVDAALAHDDGSVARLGLIVGQRYAPAGVSVEADTILATDPSPELRATALALLADDTELVGATLNDDDSATVRLVAAQVLALDPSGVDAAERALPAEAWPEVRVALLRRLLQAGTEPADEVAAAWLARAPADDAAAVAAALVTRDAGLSESFDAVVARADLPAWAAARWIAASLRGDGDPARWAHVHESADDPALRRAALDALQARPELALPRARAAATDPDDTVRAAATALLCLLGDAEAAHGVQAGDAFPRTAAALDACDARER